MYDGNDITVVIPAHNASKYIEDALESVCSQTMLPSRILVVENKSTDKTLDVVKNYESKSKVPIETISLTCGGVSNARNVGFSFVNTEFIAMLDADDLYENTFLEKSVAAINEVPQLSVFFGNRRRFDQDGNIGQSFLENTRLMGVEVKVLGSTRIISDGLFDALLYGNFISCSGSVLRSGSAYAAGLFPTNLKNSEDRYFFCKLALEGNAAYTLDNTHFYRINPSSASSTALDDSLYLQSDLALKMLDTDVYERKPELSSNVNSARCKLTEKYLYQCADKGFSRFFRGLGLIREFGGRLGFLVTFKLFFKSLKNS